MDDARTAIETTAEGDFGPLVKVRKFVYHVEEVLHEFGPPAETPQFNLNPAVEGGLDSQRPL